MRRAAMDWLEQRTASDQGFHPFRRDELRGGFALEGQPLPLVAPQQGIWKPAVLDAALSICTTYTSPGQAAPYQDVPGADGLLRYKYRGQDPGHAENRALRAAMAHSLPLIWFLGVAPGLYEAIRPVWLIAEEAAQCQFVVAVDEAQRRILPGGEASVDARRYAERLTRQRVHQPLFRSQVISAYEQSCAMCHLKYVGLLDAAHILRDGHPRGDPVVPNGLSLCKIHHAAFDQNLIGVHPYNLRVEVRPDVREQHDGPMLRHGLQEMQGVALEVPRSRLARPDTERLAERWKEFQAVG